MEAHGHWFNQVSRVYGINHEEKRGERRSVWGGDRSLAGHQEEADKGKQHFKCNIPQKPWIWEWMTLQGSFCLQWFMQTIRHSGLHPFGKKVKAGLIIVMPVWQLQESRERNLIGLEGNVFSFNRTRKISRRSWKDRRSYLWLLATQDKLPDFNSYELHFLDLFTCKLSLFRSEYLTSSLCVGSTSVIHPGRTSSSREQPRKWCESSTRSNRMICITHRGVFSFLLHILPCIIIYALTNSSLRQVSGRVAGPLALKWPVADNREEHVRSLQEVQQQHRRRDHPLLHAGGNAARLLSLDLRVLVQRAPGARHARYFFQCEHIWGSSCNLEQLWSTLIYCFIISLLYSKCWQMLFFI